MNELDFILLFVILLGVVIGLRRGFIRILISIVGIYFTVLIAGYVCNPMARTLSGGLRDAFGAEDTLTTTVSLSYLVVLIAMTVIVEIVSRSTFEETHLPRLRGLDNLLGSLVGIWYGALWASLLLIPIQYGGGGSWAESIRESMLVPTLNDVFRTSVLDIVSVLFINFSPGLYHWGVPQKELQLFLNLVCLRHFPF
jgi:uncharacterized membrane protein required for colicin V production